MPHEHLVAPLANGELGGSDSDFVVVEWSDAGYPGHEWIAPLHVHHEDDEAWYVIEGVMRFQIGAETFEAGPGSAVLAPKSMPHTFGNARPGQKARYMLVMTPRIRALVAALHADGVLDRARVVKDHASELLA